MRLSHRDNMMDNRAVGGMNFKCLNPTIRRQIYWNAKVQVRDCSCRWNPIGVSDGEDYVWLSDRPSAFENRQIRKVPTLATWSSRVDPLRNRVDLDIGQ